MAITSTQELYAIWNVNTYTVTFDPNGGTVSPTSKTVVYDAKYGDLPIATKVGSTFNGFVKMNEWTA